MCPDALQVADRFTSFRIWPRHSFGCLNSAIAISHPRLRPHRPRHPTRFNPPCQYVQRKLNTISTVDRSGGVRATT